MTSERVIGREAARRAEDDVSHGTGMGDRVAAAQVVRGDLLVHGVDLHVLVEVPARPHGIPPVGAGRGEAAPTGAGRAVASIRPNRPETRVKTSVSRSC